MYTEQERKENFQKTLKLYEPFKIAQRLLAIAFGVPYVIAWFITFAASFKFDVSAQLTILSGDMGTIVLAIIGFYFLGGATTGLFSKKK